jgi:hypothetical protein
MGLMFCRYCGAIIAEDSLFCSKCGRNLGAVRHPRLAKIVQTLRLKTPYPYFALLLAGFIAWAIGPRQSHADYSAIKWSFELDRNMDFPEDRLFQHSLSLILENGGETTVADIPVELTATIEPQKPAEVEAGFLGRKLLIMRQGQSLPLIIVLADPIEPGAKRRYYLEGRIDAAPPFKVTYEVREEGRSTVLASYAIEQ